MSHEVEHQNKLTIARFSSYKAAPFHFNTKHPSECERTKKKMQTFQQNSEISLNLEHLCAQHFPLEKGKKERKISFSEGELISFIRCVCVWVSESFPWELISTEVSSTAWVSILWCGKTFSGVNCISTSCARLQKLFLFLCLFGSQSVSPTKLRKTVSPQKMKATENV